jgi:hypothetical protein
MPKNLTIISINMNHSNYKLTALLEMCSVFCLLIQEPRWCPLAPHWLDVNPEGKPVLGMVNHPQWMAFTPPLSSLDSHPRVTTFICKCILLSLMVTPLPKLVHYYILSLNLRGPDFHLQIINYYHHIQQHQDNLTHLLECFLDHHAPILRGDFNTHFELWGP